MRRGYLCALSLAIAWLWMLAAPTPSDADDTETCATKYPNAPTSPPEGYVYVNESDAYMAFRRAAIAAGLTSVKKMKREQVTSGPCEDHGEHLNMDGRNGKGEWRHVGSMTSCEICEETPRGPKLRQPIWRIHPKF
ncbi:hypothetical protein [Haliangium sp.]|uniref:hypothetical protein n=1 Tax=Haliangium sp. TaxID=2663208 RepID=UPI003D123B48